MTKITKASIDLGNDTIKAHINEEDLAIPSVIAPSSALAKKHFTSDREENEYFKHFEDYMDASVSSPAVNTQNRIYVGQAAINSGETGRRFDVNSFSGKSADDLSVLLMLTTIASWRVKHAYFNKENLFNPLSVTVNLTTALPIREAKELNVIDHYQDKFLASSHTVVFYNFDQLITVNIRFNKVLCTLEGQASQIAIKNPKMYPQLGQSIVNYLHSHYPNLKHITLDQILQAKQVVLEDIGGKTSDFAVLANGRANINVSNSIIKGYDSVLLRSIDLLQDAQRNFNSIGQLESYLAEGPSVFDPAPYKQVEDVVKAQSESFANDVLQGLSKVLGQGRLNPELAFVCGGGSIAMAKYTDLDNQMQKMLSSFNGGRDVPIIWIDPKFAQKLNMMGLILLQQALD